MQAGRFRQRSAVAPTLFCQHLLDAKSQMQQSAKAVEQSKAVIDASQTPGGGDGGGGGGGGADGGGGVKTDDM